MNTNDTADAEAPLLDEVRVAADDVLRAEKLLDHARARRDAAIMVASKAGIGSRRIGAVSNMGHTGVRKIILRDQ